MSKLPSLYVFVFESEDRSIEVRKALEDEEWASEVIIDFNAAGTGRIYAAIVVDAHANVTHLCRLVRLQVAGLNRRTVALSELEEFSSSESAYLAKEILAARGNKRRETPIESLGRLLPSENEKIFRQVDQDDPVLADKLRKKGKADDRALAEYSQHEREIIGLERDVVGLALEVAFGDRENLVVDLVNGKPTAFLAMLPNTHLLEDEVVLHEKDRFPGLVKLKDATPRVTEFEHNGSKLRVIHANRNDLEHTLGVDLIYVSDYFRSIVGVQYKMMKGSRESGYYSPEKNFEKQLLKMTSVSSLLSKSPVTSQLDYRLNYIPFYFKFVSRLETNFADEKLCPGLYLPFDLVSKLLNATPPEKIGARHGTRHLSNTEFASLIRQGWIGSNSKSSSIIEKIVIDALNDKRSVTIAIQAGPPVLY